MFTAAVETIEQELPSAPAGSVVQWLSVDGAMIPPVQQEWAEVKRLALGTVGKSVSEAGEGVVEQRLKGTGVHWSCRHVKPMVALRTLDCSDR
jgi:hypothetical protein